MERQSISQYSAGPGNQREPQTKEGSPVSEVRLSLSLLRWPLSISLLQPVHDSRANSHGNLPRRDSTLHCYRKNQEIGIFHPSYWEELGSTEKVTALKRNTPRSLCTELADLLPCPVVPDTMNQGLAVLLSSCIFSSKLMWPWLRIIGPQMPEKWTNFFSAHSGLIGNRIGFML